MQVSEHYKLITLLLCIFINSCHNLSSTTSEPVEVGASAGGGGGGGGGGDGGGGGGGWAPSVIKSFDLGRDTSAPINPDQELLKRIPKKHLLKGYLSEKVESWTQLNELRKKYTPKALATLQSPFIQFTPSFIRVMQAHFPHLVDEDGKKVINYVRSMLRSAIITRQVDMGSSSEHTYLIINGQGTNNKIQIYLYLTGMKDPLLRVEQNETLLLETRTARGMHSLNIIGETTSPSGQTRIFAPVVKDTPIATESIPPSYPPYKTPPSSPRPSTRAIEVDLREKPRFVSYQRPPSPAFDSDLKWETPSKFLRHIIEDEEHAKRLTDADINPSDVSSLTNAMQLAFKAYPRLKPIGHWYTPLKDSSPEESFWVPLYRLRGTQPIGRPILFTTLRKIRARRDGRVQDIYEAANSLTTEQVINSAKRLDSKSQHMLAILLRNPVEDITAPSADLEKMPPNVLRRAEVAADPPCHRGKNKKKKKK